MTSEPNESRERLEELYITDLLFGLTEEERAEFDSLDTPQGRDELSRFSDLIALLDVARSTSQGAQLPHSLRERIRSDARTELRDVTSVVPKSAQISRSNARLPWTVALVSLLVAVLVLATNWPFGRQAEVTRDAAQMRGELLASASDLIRADWSDGPTPFTGAGGDVAWSAGEQQGYMRFRGMPMNDPSVEQYQLWIFDKNQDEKTPVDGGVFDISSTGEVVVPIQAKLYVREPYLFAITVEKPGGVVVSDRSRLPLVATLAP